MGRVLHASGSGYFPFCLYTGTTGIGQGTMRPFGITIENCMYLYWRVKKWRFSFEYQQVSLEYDFFNLSGQPGSRGAPDGYSPPQSEQEIVCRNGFSGLSLTPATFVGFEAPGSIFPQFYVLEMGMFLGGASESDPIEPNTGTYLDPKNMVYFNKNNNLYYPIFSFRAVLTYNDFPGWSIGISSSTLFGTSVLFPVKNGIGEPIFYIPCAVTILGEGATQSYFSKAELKAIEYWPYEGLYDTTTGEPF